MIDRMSIVFWLFLAYWPIGHKLLAYPGVIVSVVGDGSSRHHFSSLFSQTTASNTSKLAVYIQPPYIGIYKNSSLHVDPKKDSLARFLSDLGTKILMWNIQFDNTVEP